MISCTPPQGEEGAVGPSVQELPQAEHRVSEQDEFEDVLEVV
jgi:hypothetical protein